MNKELFRSMQEQLRPSGAARSALMEKLAAGKKRPAPGIQYLAAAVYAALVLIVPVCGAVGNYVTGQDAASDARPAAPHSYVVLEDAAGRPEDGIAAAESDTGAGDREAVNTGEAPEEDAPSQEEAVMAYQNLMARFAADCGPGAYPEWYGGAYIDGHGGLIVNIVESYSRGEDDKALCLQIQDWAGSGRVGFGSSRYSLGALRRLQDEAFQAMSDLGLAVGCGVNEETGQVELTLSSVTDEALWRLAELDPADDAILVLAGQAASVDDGAEEPVVSHVIQPGGDPANEDDAIAWEPQDPAPHVDEIIQPEPEEANTASYDLLT